MTLSQAELGRRIAAERAKAKRGAEKDFKDWLDKQAMSEADRAKAEKEASDKAAETARFEALVDKIETRAERYAIAHGVDPKRVEKFLRVVGEIDVDDLSDDGKPDNDAIEAMIKAQVADNPEFKAAANGKAGASGGEFNGDNGPEQLTREQLKGMSPQEIVKAKKEGRLKAALGQK